MKYFGEPNSFLRFMCGGSENVCDILPEICSSILWHENAIGDLEIFSHIQEGP